ncbi:MAG: hypothetical protein PVG30_08565 [Gammaproteobacteria bacterium]|jgi:4-amino-4-deoxy-L-arabinose transferase-like glycosyltransferase
MEIDIKRIFFIVALIVVFFCGVFLRYQSTLIPYHHGPDEMIYGYRAYQISLHGRAASIRSAKQDIQNKKMQLYPPPTRIGYLVPLAGIMKVSHQYNLLPGVLLSFFASVGSLLLLIIFGLRFFNRWTTLIALTVYAVCPIAVMLAGRALQDSLAGFLGLLILYFSSETISNQSKKIWPILLILVGNYTLLIKTPLFVFFALCFLLVLFFLNFPKLQIKKSFYFSVLAFLGFVCSMLILASWSGGIKNVFMMWYLLMHAGDHSNYVFYQTASISQFLFNFYINSILMSVFFIIGMVLTIVNYFTKSRFFIYDKKNEKVHIFAFIVCIAFFLVVALMPSSQNLRYVPMLFVPIYLLASNAIFILYQKLKSIIAKRWIIALLTTVLILLVLVGSLRDYAVYKKLFIKYRIYDPAPVFLMRAYEISR